MSDEITEQINSIRRTVGTRTLEAGEARVVTVSRAYAAEVDDVWAAFTERERIIRWFLPVTGELKAGGHYQFEGNAGGTIERCDPPTGFDATWEYGEEVSWIQLRLSPEPGGRTRVQLEHVAHVDDERWAQFGPGAVGTGWDLGFLGLIKHLEGGPWPEAGNGPEEAAAWSVSEEGKRFITLSSQGWGAAAVEAGEDPAQAEAAAGRTTAFYTGT